MILLNVFLLNLFTSNTLILSYKNHNHTQTIIKNKNHNINNNYKKVTNYKNNSNYKKGSEKTNMYDTNPLSIYQSQNSADIKGTSDSYKGMILRQLDRVVNLITIGNAKYQGQEQMFTTETLAHSALRGIQALEAMITPIMNEDYEDKTRPIKQQLIKTIKRITEQELEFYDYYNQWLTEIIKHLDKFNMLPEKEIEMEFE